MVSVFYGSQDLREMVEHALVQKLQFVGKPPESYSNKRTDPSESIELVDFCSLIAWFRHPEIDDSSDLVSVTKPDPVALSSAIQNGLERLTAAQNILIEPLFRNIDSILTIHQKVFFESVTPYLLISLLARSKISNTELISIIERYVEGAPAGLVTADDRAAFTETVDWSDPTVLRLFSRFDLSWMKPSTARGCLAAVIDQRVRTVAALEYRASELPEAPPISSWFAMSWIQAVHDSDGSTERSTVELIEYLSTFGCAGAGAAFSPTALGYIENLSTPSLDTVLGLEDGIDSGMLFRPGVGPLPVREWHYTSMPCEDPFIGLKLNGYAFKVDHVSFAFVPPPATVYQGPMRLKLEIADKDGKLFVEQKRVIDGQASFELRKAIAFSRLRLVMMGHGERNVLRANMIKINGVFDATCPKS
jgi:hypothetical protein